MQDILNVEANKKKKKKESFEHFPTLFIWLSYDLYIAYQNKN